jgi:hypothetical protein
MPARNLNRSLLFILSAPIQIVWRLSKFSMISARRTA